MTEPRTEAGKRLLEHIGIVAWFDEETEYADHLAAIEAEATVRVLEELAEQVRGLPTHLTFCDESCCRDGGLTISRNTILALLEPRQTPPSEPS